MNVVSWPRTVRWGMSFVVLTLVLGWPFPELRARASDVFCAVVNPLLSVVTFGEGGHARLFPQHADEHEQPVEKASFDSALLLTIDGYRGQMPMGMSIRRDFYLPLCIALAAIATAPLPWRRRLTALALGLMVVFGFCLASLWTTCLWLFARLPAGKALSEHTRLFLDTLVGSLLMPPGVHFFVPVLIALFVVWGFVASARPVPS